MKKNRILFLSTISLTLIFFACENGSTDTGTGTIRIISVTPDSGLIDGEYTDFTVVVAYTLEGVDQAYLSVAYNTYEVEAWREYAYKDVYRSSVEKIETFTVTDVPGKDWGESGDFSVLVIIAPVEGGICYAGDMEVLTF